MSLYRSSHVYLSERPSISLDLWPCCVCCLRERVTLAGRVTFDLPNTDGFSCGLAWSGRSVKSSVLDEYNIETHSSLSLCICFASSVFMADLGSVFTRGHQWWDVILWRFSESKSIRFFILSGFDWIVNVVVWYYWFIIISPPTWSWLHQQERRSHLTIFNNVNQTHN